MQKEKKKIVMKQCNERRDKLSEGGRLKNLEERKKQKT